MICKNCNAEIDNNAAHCPFCGAPTTVQVDPNMGIPQQNAGAQPNPYGQPAQNGTSYTNPNTYGQPDQNPYGQSNPNPYGGQPMGYMDPSAEYEKKANTVQTLGIVALICSIVIGFCCCVLPGPIVGIVGLVKANALQGDMYLLSPEGQKKVNTGKILCIIAVVLGALGLLFNILMMATGFTESMMDEFDF